MFIKSEGNYQSQISMCKSDDKTTQEFVDFDGDGVVDYYNQRICTTNENYEDWFDSDGDGEFDTVRYSKLINKDGVIGWTGTTFCLDDNGNIQLN
ncbi:hypothetical protein IJ425_00945 [bacterium]|nr:hypothetical protein [bacterium]